MGDSNRPIADSKSCSQDSYIDEKAKDETIQPVRDVEHLEIDAVAEQKLIRKVDRHIIPMVMMLYLFVCHYWPKQAVL